MKNRAAPKQGQAPLRVVVSGGGTGGHIYPALAIAQGLKEAAGGEILYMGGPHSLESRLAPQAGLEFAAVESRGLKGLSFATLGALLSHWRGMGQAKKILRNFAPHVVIGTGGYASVPTLFAAGRLGIPTLIHEQNAYPGLANRFLSRSADCLCLTFEGAQEHFPPRIKTIVTGLPVRKSILLAEKDQALANLGLSREKPVLLAYGGSQGARSINQALIPALPALLEAGAQIIHICGPSHYEDMQKALQDLGMLDREGLLLLSYSDSMENPLAAADLAIARAGASFIAELTVRGLPAVLVPYPYAAANHQALNARSLQKAGAALMIEDRALNAQSLLKAVLPLLEDRTGLKEMSARALSLAKPQALEDIVSLALELAQKQRQN